MHPSPNCIGVLHAQCRVRTLDDLSAWPDCPYTTHRPCPLPSSPCKGVAVMYRQKSQPLVTLPPLHLQTHWNTEVFTRRPAQAAYKASPLRFSSSPCEGVAVMYRQEAQCPISLPLHLQPHRSTEVTQQTDIRLVRQPRQRETLTPAIHQ